MKIDPLKILDYAVAFMTGGPAGLVSEGMSNIEKGNKQKEESAKQNKNFVFNSNEYPYNGGNASKPNSSPYNIEYPDLSKYNQTGRDLDSYNKIANGYNGKQDDLISNLARRFTGNNKVY